MITYYGYCDGSGEFYVVIDAERCDGCQKCVAICPQKALKMETLLIDLDDRTVAAVKEEHRKKIKYTCQPCKPETGNAPCVTSCSQNAIKCVWVPR
jgi:NAD-dependent dihydropyrimidine dehydrogenase PreA subunit